MIEKIRIRGYRKFRDLVVNPATSVNILVGDNESGKSTIIEAIGLAMTGRVNGRTAQDELNPYWFNQDVVRDFFRARANGQDVALPTISIEVFLADEDDVPRLKGAHNSDVPTRAFGVVVQQDPHQLEHVLVFEDQIHHLAHALTLRPPAEASQASLAHRSLRRA